MNEYREIGIMEPIISLVENDFFANNPVLIDEEKEGDEYDGENYILGCKAGPFRCVTNLLHEMSHLVELEFDRFLKFPSGGWGFSHGSPVVVNGRTYYEMTNDKSVLREGRVWAYQLALQRYYGIKTSPIDTIAAVKHMEAWYLYRCKVAPDKSMVASERDRLALEKFATMVDQLSRSEFTVMRFKKEWKRRMRALDEKNQEQ